MEDGKQELRRISQERGNFPWAAGVCVEVAQTQRVQQRPQCVRMQLWSRLG